MDATKQFFKLPRVDSQAYMSEWGGPKSANRLRKMAESIAAFCRNSERKSWPDDQAIDEWEADLALLKQTYYDGVYDKAFAWPFTA